MHRNCALMAAISVAWASVRPNFSVIRACRFALRSALSTEASAVAGSGDAVTAARAGTARRRAAAAAVVLKMLIFLSGFGAR